MLLNNAPGSVAAVARGQSRVLMTQAVNPVTTRLRPGGCARRAALSRGPVGSRPVAPNRVQMNELRHRLGGRTHAVVRVANFIDLAIPP
jgi:hypothetical protein